MTKKSVVVALAILFSALLVAPASADYNELEQKIQELSKSLEKLEGIVKDLSFQFQQTLALSSIVKELSFQLKKTESAVHDLQGLSRKVEEEIRPRLLTLEGTLQGLASSFNEKLSVFQGRVFDLETSVQGLDARTKSIEGKVRELLTLEMQLRQLEKRLAALEQQAGKMTMDPKMDLVMQLQELKDRLQMTESAIADLSAQLDRSRSRISTLELTKANVEEVDALRAKVAQLEQQLETQLEELRSQTSLSTALGGLALAAGLVALASVFGII
jgi:DNA repair exonuclease SbcCD ATPase subunit